VVSCVKGEYKWKILENNMFTKIFGPKKVEVIKAYYMENELRESYRLNSVYNNKKLNSLVRKVKPQRGRHTRNLAKTVNQKMQTETTT
jgi:hypothetical protein